MAAESLKYTDTSVESEPGVGCPGRKGLKITSREAEEASGEKRYMDRSGARTANRHR